MPKVYKNPGPLTFSATIQEDTKGSGTWIDFPYDLKETYGVGNLVPFKATFDGRVTYQGSLAKMGGKNAMILLRKDTQASLGKNPGETVEVVVALDDTPRTVIVPADMKGVLQKASLWELFEKLSYTHRKEYVRWIEEAKKEETRRNRLQKMPEMIASGKKGI